MILHRGGVRRSPRDLIADDGVGDAEQLSGDSRDGNFGGFAFGHEIAVVRLQRFGHSHRGQGGEVEATANAGSTSDDVALALLFAAVAVERRQADEVGDFAASEPAEFGQVSEEHAGGLIADAGNRLEEFVVGLPDEVGSDEGADLLVEPFDPAGEPADMGVDVAANGFVGDGLFAVLFGDAGLCIRRRTCRECPGGRRWIPASES